jgi:A/G-specific adenine glycosylase
VSRPIDQHPALAEALRLWFSANARDLPWRCIEADTGLRDPYRSLVSELMLQQTQVSRVLEKFEPFMERFPTVQALADADEQEVLAAWSGLGYYRRARLLHGAAQDITNRFDGILPRTVDELMSITGIGRYTAGAIASIVFHEPAPLVDGNVSRVLMRLRGDERAPSDKGAIRKNWEDAGQIASAASSPAMTNEGLMELGALVCTPKSPRCDTCTLAEHCQARKQGLQDRIPAPKKAPSRSRVYHTALVACDESGRVLAERRTSKGLWASMWQAPTVESDTHQPGPGQVLKRLGISGKTSKVSEFTHLTSHREVVFKVHRLRGALPESACERLPQSDGMALISLCELDNLPLANPHRRILMGG